MLEFLEEHWKMTCRDALDHWREARRQSIIKSKDIPQKRKTKLLEDWPRDQCDVTIPEDAVCSGSIAIFDKLHGQGFVNEKSGPALFERAILGEKIDILNRLKSYNLCPQEICYFTYSELSELSELDKKDVKKSCRLQASDLCRLVQSKTRLGLHWLHDNEIPIRTSSELLSALDVVRIVEQDILPYC